MEKIYANVMIAKVYNTILGDLKKKLIVFRDGKVFEGALFWPMDSEDMIMEIVSVNHVEGTVWDVMIEAYGLLKVNGMIAKDDKTLLTMLHWQHVNGFSDEIFVEAYGAKNDTEYLAKRERRTNMNILNQLATGDYYIYQINDGGCGIVKAVSAAHAAEVVAIAYHDNTGVSYDTSDIEIHPLNDGDNHYFSGNPNVIELGWKIETC